MKLRKLLESVDFAALKKQFRSTIPKVPSWKGKDYLKPSELGLK